MEEMEKRSDRHIRDWHMQTASKSPFYGAFGLVTPSGVSPGVTAKDARWPRFAK